MGIVSSAVLYFLIWWVVIFITLPFGNRAVEHVQPGHAGSAPVHHNMGRKVIVTTIVSFFLWLWINPAVHHFLDYARDGGRKMSEQDKKQD